ncbi:MAG: DUF4097 family beta strand repeat-containing protein [Acutalibacteraceae bacterium]
MTDFQKIIKYIATAFAVLLIVGIFSGIFGSLQLLGVIYDAKDHIASDSSMEAYAVSGEIKSLKAEISAADFVISVGKKLSVESNVDSLTVEEKDGELVLRDGGTNLFQNGSSRKLILTVPEKFTFSRVDITTGAGKLTADDLRCQELRLELGVGRTNIKNLIALKNAKISGGVGELNIGFGKLKNLKLEMGVGNLTLEAALPGKSELDCGVGEMDITLIGSVKDYTVELDKGLGNAVIDGVNAGDDYVCGSGSNHVEIDGGLGNVTVSFSK